MDPSHFLIWKWQKRSSTMEIGHSLGCERRIFSSYPRSFLLCPQTTVGLLSPPTLQLDIIWPSPLLYHYFSCKWICGSQARNTGFNTFGDSSPSAILFFQGKNLLDFQVPESCSFIHQKHTEYLLACILPGTMDPKMNKICFLTRETGFIQI